MSSATPAKGIIFLGLDVHKESVTIAVLPADATAPTRIDKYSSDFAKLRRVFERHAQLGELRACYEASGAGYVLQRALQRAARGPPAESPAPRPAARPSGRRVERSTGES